MLRTSTEDRKRAWAVSSPTGPRIATELPGRRMLSSRTSIPFVHGGEQDVGRAAVAQRDVLGFRRPGWRRSRPTHARRTATGLRRLDSVTTRSSRPSVSWGTSRRSRISARCQSRSLAVRISIDLVPVELGPLERLGARRGRARPRASSRTGQTPSDAPRKRRGPGRGPRRNRRSTGRVRRPRIPRPGTASG